MPLSVDRIFSYPVKSMIGGEVESVSLSSLGIEGDRHWAVRDLRNGGIRGAKKIGDLMRFAAHDAGSDAVEITAPDGTHRRSDDPDVDGWLSERLGQPVRLEPLAPADDLDHYRRGAPTHTDIVAELRDVFGRDADEPFPDFSVFPPEVAEFESPPGTHHDCWPLMIMSTSALRSMRDALPGSAIDWPRFRPSIVIDTGDEPGHPEFTWKGRTATIGTAVIEFLAPCPRCVMITREIDHSLPADRAILRHVVRDLDQNVGIYARIVTPGLVGRGDPLVFG